MRTRFFAGSLAGLLFATPLLAVLCWMCVSDACARGTATLSAQTAALAPSHRVSPPAPHASPEPNAHGADVAMPCHGVEAATPAAESASQPASPAPCHNGGDDGADCCVAEATFPETERVAMQPGSSDLWGFEVLAASPFLQVQEVAGRFDGARRAPPPRDRSLHALHSTWLI
ncbi:MAG: hypothetical protein AAFY88_16500 [Acidobacteriota bacterium]